MHFNALHKYLIFLHALTTLQQCWTLANEQQQEQKKSNNNNVAYNNNNNSNNVDTSTTTIVAGAVNENNNFEEILSQQLQNENEKSSEKFLLSRKRRYLSFPEGSSFQLVYDAIIGVVDYTNYLILGITVALAWELPSKAPSELVEEIEERFKQGTLGLRRNDTETNVIYVDTKKKIQTHIQPNYINLMQTLHNNKPGFNNYYANRRIQQPVFIPPMHKKYQYNNYYQQPSSNRFTYKQRPTDWRRKDNNYYSTKRKNPFIKWLRPKQNYKFTPNTAANNVKYPWWNLTSRLSNSMSKKQRPMGPSDRRLLSPQSSISSSAAAGQFDMHHNRNQQQREQKQFPHTSRSDNTAAPASHKQSNSARPTRKHRIYPVFGKRSLSDAAAHNTNNNNNTNYKDNSSITISYASTTFATNSTSSTEEKVNHHHRQRRSGIIGSQLTKLERIHIRHHRSTRQTLYEKIEKYLDKMGQNGHHCVLRALCETGQKSAEQQPGTFVGELMRAVFTLPEALDEDLQAQRVQYKDQRYDTANAYADDCAIRYQLCKGSLWKTEFVA